MNLSTLDKPIQQLIKQLDHQLGKGTPMRLGDAEHLQIETLSTGIPELDAVLGGGLPKGRIIENFGTESSGKTTLALHAIAHDEDVLQWSAAIAQWFKAVPTHHISFSHLCQSLGMPQVEVWLGVLLGEFELEGGEEFYSDALWVKTAAVDSEAATVKGTKACSEHPQC